MGQREFRRTLADYLAARRRRDGYTEQKLRRRLETSHALEWNAWRQWNADPADLTGRAQGRPASTSVDHTTRRAARAARRRARRRLDRRRPAIG